MSIIWKIFFTLAALGIAAIAGTLLWTGSVPMIYLKALASLFIVWTVIFLISGLFGKSQRPPAG